ncbi:nuclear transport factor 2-like isoform X2 [Mangifera indica]|uniref:nuclear transport factor 2-like isoform X2 n=1 Tax=Mangifera indica TaxID=29780 RepID=UPI001CFAFC6A|nr:nuclear transport factor 2-like isoform X2 [Mangifera indica]
MALQTASPPSAQVVGNAFVGQYYHILVHSPELAHRFYHDSSMLSRPNANGEMTSVTTMKGINEKILSLDFKNCEAEIKTVDAQESHMGGVSLLVTGCLMGNDNLRRKFVQSFFLAPQDNGYFVQNDIFRYVEDSEVLEKYPVNNIDDTPAVPPFPDSVESHSICIRNLPLYTKNAELEAELKKFGPIKERGIQVRNSKVYCLGFVEFVSSTSADKAIQASPVTIGGQKAVIERKKNTRVGSARGSYPPEREKIQIDNIRVRGNYAGGRRFEGDFSGRDNLGKVKVISKGEGDRRGNRSGVPRQTVE